MQVNKNRIVMIADVEFEYGYAFYGSGRPEASKGSLKRTTALFKPSLRVVRNTNAGK
jgi:hypothetical protein